LKAKKGWYINFQEYDNAWEGEKGLAAPLILDGKIFFTTYIPNESNSDDPCKPAVEGNGRLYAINLLNGAAVYDDLYTADVTAADDPQNLTIEDRRNTLGGGIPSSADGLFLEGGVYVIVGTGGGATVFNPKLGLLRKRTFWQQQNIN
jgi:type IV pilus assembly protein PilY1